MTPLVRFYARHLPARAVLPSVTGTYAAALILLLIFADPVATDTVYIDIEPVK